MVGGLFLILVIIIIIIAAAVMWLIKKRRRVTERGVQKEQFEGSIKISQQAINEFVIDQKNDKSSSREIITNDNVAYVQVTPNINTEANVAYGGTATSFTVKNDDMLYSQITV